MLEVKVTLPGERTLELLRTHQTVFIKENGKTILILNEAGLDILLDALNYVRDARFY